MNAGPEAADEPCAMVTYTFSRAQKSNYADLAEVTFDAVRRGRSAYSELQRERWLPAVKSGEEWDNRLDTQTIFIGRSHDSIAGFMSVDGRGYIDLAHIRPSAQGTGLFRQLFEMVERHSLTRRDPRLWVHASLMAQPAFTAMGFNIVERQTVHIGDVSLDRFEMEKHLRSVG